MSLERWAKLKKVEEFQLQAAERLYREGQWKAAADEYEKFLKLYEKSEGAPYAQLKYSHCLVQLRKQNAAIKDGYQSLLDYYPDSPEAPIAAYLIGRTYKEIGDTKPAEYAPAEPWEELFSEGEGSVRHLGKGSRIREKMNAEERAILARERG